MSIVRRYNIAVMGCSGHGMEFSGMNGPLRRSLAAVVAIALLFTSSALRGETTSRASAKPADVVRTFYTYHFAHDMGFSEAAVRERSAWLAPELVDLCHAYFQKPVRPDEVPDVNGDPFTDSQEYPKSFSVGRPSVSDTIMRVPVTLSWPDHRRTIRVLLKVVDGSWRITNITYGGLRSLRTLLSSGS
jgi:hypothetical protein